MSNSKKSYGQIISLIAVVSLFFGAPIIVTISSSLHDDYLQRLIVLDVFNFGFLFAIPIASAFVFHHFFTKTVKKSEGTEKLELSYRFVTIFVSVIVGFMVFLPFGYVHNLMYTYY